MYYLCNVKRDKPELLTKTFTIMNYKEFSAVVSAARTENKETFSNPFVIINLLNKAAKGDFTKVNNCSELTRENTAKVAKVCKGMHSNRYAFDVCLFEKDYKGRFCTISTTKVTETISDYMDLDGISALVVTDKKGREVTLIPIPLTINAYFSAFAKVAKVDIKSAETAEKAAEKAAKDAVEE